MLLKYKNAPFFEVNTCVNLKKVRFYPYRYQENLSQNKINFISLFFS